MVYVHIKPNIQVGEIFFYTQNWILVKFTQLFSISPFLLKYSQVFVLNNFIKISFYMFYSFSSHILHLEYFS